MKIITDRIDALNSEITELHKEFKNADYPERSNLLNEIRFAMCERGRIRALGDSELD